MPAENDTGTVFRDVIMMALMGLVAIVVLLLLLVNPPKQEESAKPPGSLLIEIVWPDSSPADVDLWVQGPGDRPVGYSRKNGNDIDLLRDDLGSTRDATDFNYENAVSRGVPAGEYTVNVHLFATKGAPLPLTVDVTIQIVTQTGDLREIGRQRIALTRQGEEITVLRFRMDGQQQVVPESVNRLPKPLRAARNG